MGTASKENEEVEEIIEFDDDCILGYDDIMEQEDLVYKDLVMDAFWKPKAGKKHAVVRIQVMNGVDRDAFEALVSTKVNVKNKDDFTIKNMSDVRITLIQKCLVNTKGEKVFSHKKLKELNTKSSAAIQFIFDECQTLNKLSNDDVEELAKDLSDDLKDTSGSNSLNG